MLKVLGLSAAVSLVTVVSGPPPTQPTSSLLYIFGAFCAGGVLTLVWNIVMRWKRGQVEDTELINRITQQTIQGADDILGQYRIEVEVIKRQVEDYRVQLHDVTKELSLATLRIANLERELAYATDERQKLRHDLQDALATRNNLTREVQNLKGKIDELLTK